MVVGCRHGRAAARPHLTTTAAGSGHDGGVRSPARSPAAGCTACSVRAFAVGHQADRQAGGGSSRRCSRVGPERWFPTVPPLVSCGLMGVRARRSRCDRTDPGGSQDRWNPSPGFVPPPSTHEMESHRDVPTTSPSRTIVDVAGIVGPRSLSRTIEQAAVLGVLDIPEIDRILGGPRRRGSPQLRSILEGWRRYSREPRLRSIHGGEAAAVADPTAAFRSRECNDEVDPRWREIRDRLPLARAATRRSKPTAAVSTTIPTR